MSVLVKSEFIKQCKGVDADKLKISDSEKLYVSVKYDGVYVQVHKTGDVVQFFTSSGKEFSCIYCAEFKKLDFDFKIETEYTVDGGKLGTRFKANQEIQKAVKDSSFELTGKFMIFDSLESGVARIYRDFTFPKVDEFESVFNYLMDFLEAKSLMKQNLKDGWEGFFLIKPSHIQEGKKSKDAVKLKHKFTADLIATGVDGLCVSLVDENGVVAKVTVGSDVAAMVEPGVTVVEIEYEQIIKSYNVAVFKDIRFDKMAS